MKLINKGGYLKAENYKIIDYSDDYYKHLTDKYETEQQREMNTAINKIRIFLVNDFCAMQSILDYGCGTGNFIKYMDNNGMCYTYGYELIPQTIAWLTTNGKYIDPYKEVPSHIKAITMWDVLEHIPDHKPLFDKIKQNTYLFVSIPIFDDLDKVKESKHYIPNQHIWYYTENGFIDYMASHNFNCIECNDMEEKAGREQIKTFVFRKL